MKILLAYYSRKKHTQKLAERIRDEITTRGHDLADEVVRPVNLPSNKYLLALKCFPGIPRALFSTFVRRLHDFYQYEVEIEPPEHPDLSRFDRIVIGGPKWLHLSFPLAKYLKKVEGLSGKKVAGFATMAGPPFPVYGMHLYFGPFENIVRSRGGEVIAQIGVSTGFQDYIIMMPLYRVISRIWLGKPVSHFLLDSEWAQQEITRFVDRIEGRE